MSEKLEVVRRHFDRDATRFDSIYETKKPVHHRVMDRFRQVVVERFNLIRNLAPQSAGEWTVLDVGCGSGRYSVTLAAEGARRVVGVDVSEEMIRLARSDAEAAGVGERCEFHRAAFLDFRTDETFDVSVATGYYDYMDDPLPHLQKMKAHTRGRIFASFPKRWDYRVPVRKARFVWVRGFVRFYARHEVVSLFDRAGFARERVSLIDLGRDWIAVARP